MSMAYGFYWGLFYPCCSPPYDPPDNGDDVVTIGVCFAPEGQPEDYSGFLCKPPNCVQITFYMLRKAVID